jgi:guanyl-specific ribonuclease Sa
MKHSTGKTLLTALLLVWNLALSGSLCLARPDLQEPQTGQPDDNALSASLPILTPANTPVPETVFRRLPLVLPAGEGEPQALHRLVLEKRTEKSKVTLILKDEETRELARMTQSVGTMVSVLEITEKDKGADGKTAAPRDVATDVLPTLNIEKVKPGMQVLSRIPDSSKTLSRALHQTAKESIRIELTGGKSGKSIESLQGLPKTSLATPAGTLTLSKLKPGMRVLSRRGPPLLVKSVRIEKHPAGISVYSFEVAEKTTASISEKEEEPAAPVVNEPVRVLPDSVSAEEDAAVADALHHLRAGTRPSYGRKWGEPFSNREGRLPGLRGAGGYREYYVRPAPGESGPGARRLVVGANGSI